MHIPNGPAAPAARGRWSAVDGGLAGSSVPLWVLSLLAVVVLLVGSVAAQIAWTNQEFATSGIGRAINSPAAPWVKAQTCCPGCSYASGCCCPPRNSDVTVRSTRTRTVLASNTKQVPAAAKATTRKRTTTRKAKRVAIRGYGELLGPEAAAVAKGELDWTGRRGLVPDAAALGKHQCPQCPAGIKLVAATGKTDLNWCCPKRKTVTIVRTVSRTIQQAPTPRVTRTPAVVNGNKLSVAGLALKGSTIVAYAAPVVASGARRSANSISYAVSVLASGPRGLASSVVVGTTQANATTGQFSLRTSPVYFGKASIFLAVKAKGFSESAPVLVGTFTFATSTNVLPATVTVGSPSTAPTVTVACSRRASAYKLPDLFPGLPKLYLKSVVNGPFVCILTANLIGNSRTTAQLTVTVAGSEYQLFYPVTLSFVPSSFRNAGTISLSFISKPGVVAARSNLISAALPASVSSYYQPPWWEHTGTWRPVNYTVSYMFAGGWSSITDTSLLRDVRDIGRKIGPGMLPNGVATVLSNVTYSFSLPARGYWTAAVSFDTGEPIAPFGNRIVFKLRSARQVSSTSVKPPTISTLDWVIPSLGFKSSAVFKAAGRTAVWVLQGLSTSQLCSRAKSFPKSAPVVVLRMPLLQIVGPDGAFSGKIASISCQSGALRSFTATISYTQNAKLWKTNVTVNLAIPEPSLVGPTDMLPLLAATLTYNSANGLYAVKGTIQVPKLASGSASNQARAINSSGSNNVTTLVDGKIIFAAAAGSWATGAKNWLSKLLMTVPAGSITLPMSSSFPLKNTLIALGKVRGSVIPLYGTTTTTNFTFSYRPSSIQMNGSVSFNGNVGGPLVLNFALPPKAGGTSTTNHVMDTVAMIGTTKVGTIVVKLNKMPCNLPRGHPSTFDLRLLPTVWILRPIGGTNPSDRHLVEKTRMIDSKILIGRPNTARTKFNCAAGNVVRGFTISGALSKSQATAVLVMDSVVLNGLAASFTTGKPDITVTCAVHSRLPKSVKLKLYLPVSHNTNRNLLSPANPLWEILGIPKSSNKRRVAKLMLGRNSADYYLNRLNFIKSSLLSVAIQNRAFNIAMGHFQQYSSTTSSKVQYFKTRHTHFDTLTGKNVTFSVTGNNVEKVLIVVAGQTTKWPKKTSTRTTTSTTIVTAVPVANFQFVYSFASSTSSIDLDFEAGFDACQTGIQSVTVDGSNVPVIGNLAAMSGTAIFTCQNQTRQINSFYAQLNADQVVATPATSLLALNNISMSISCLPALQNCGIPSGMMGTEQYLWTSVLGLSSFQQGSNVSDYVNQTMIDIFPALAQSIPSAAPLPEFVQNNSMAYALLLGGPNQTLPTPSFLCGNDNALQCDAPALAIAGTLQFGLSAIGYSTQINWTSSSAASQLLQQTFAGALSSYGPFVASVTGNPCQASNATTSLWIQLIGLPYNIPDITQGYGEIHFICNSSYFVTAYELSFPLASTSASLALLAPGTVTLVAPTVRYGSLAGMLGFYTTYPGCPVTFALELPIQTSVQLVTSGQNTSAPLISLAAACQTTTCTINDLLALSGNTSTSPYSAFYTGFSLLPFASLTSTDALKSFAALWLPNSGILAMYGVRTVSIGPTTSLVASINVSATYNSTTGWSLSGQTFAAGFNLTTKDSVTMTTTFVPCQLGGVPSALQSSGPFAGTGSFNLTFTGIASVVGACSLQVTCNAAQTSINQANFSATVAGPFNLTLFNIVVALPALTISYTTPLTSTPGLLAVQAQFNSTVVTVTYEVNTDSLALYSLSLVQTGSASPFDPAFPFSAYWTSVIGLAEVDILAEGVTVSGLNVFYLFNSQGDSASISGTVDLGLFSASLSIALRQVIFRSMTSWISSSAQMSCSTPPLGSLTFSGSAPCGTVANDSLMTVTANLNALGPLSPVSALGSIQFTCNAPNVISGYMWTVNASTITLTAFGTPQPFTGNLLYNSTETELAMSGGPVSQAWLLSANITTSNTSFWSFSFTTGATQPFSNLPFAAGMGSAFVAASSSLSDLVAGIMTSVTVTYDNDPGSLVLFGGFVAASGSYAANASLSVVMIRSAVIAPWSISVQLPFTASFFIGGFGMVGTYGSLGCPTGNEVVYALFNIPGMSSATGNGTMSYICGSGSGSSIQSYTISLTIQNINLTLFGEQATLQNATLVYSSVTGSLNVTGTVTLGESGLVQVSAAFNIGISTVIFDKLQITLLIGTTNIWGDSLPYSGFISGSVASSGQSLVTPNAAMGELIVAFQNSPPSLAFTAAIIDGSLEGILQLQLQSTLNGSWQATSGSVAVDLGSYGSLSIVGTTPCPDGFVALSASLSIPVLGNLQLQGEADFVCNGTIAIIGYVGKLNSTYTWNLLGTTESLDGLLTYDSLTNVFTMSVGFGQAIALAYNLFNSSIYSVIFAVNGTANFSDVPFATTLGPLVDAVPTVSGGVLSTFDLLAAYFEYRNPEQNGNNQTFLFTCAVQDDITSGVTGYVNVTMMYLQATPSSSFVDSYVNVTAALKIDDIATLVFSFDNACPSSAIGVVEASFQSLPLNLPLFTASGSISFKCNGTTANYSDYTITLTAGFTPPLSLEFLGEKITIDIPSVTYASAINVFNVGWNLSSGLKLNVGFGQGLGRKTSGTSSGSNGFHWPFIFQGLPIGSVDIGSIISDIANVLDTFDSVFGGGFDFGISASNSFQQQIFGPLNSAKLSNVVIDFDSSAGGIKMSGAVNFFGFATDFFMTSPKSNGNLWSMLYGVSLFGPGSTGVFSSGLSWLDALFKPGYGIAFQNVVFGVASGGGVYSLNGLSVTTQGTGLIISGELLLTGQGMIGILEETGSFGNQLSAMSQGSASLDFAVAISETQISLAVIFSADMSASGSQSFTDIDLVFSTLLQSPQLQFDLVFTYYRVLGGDSLLFVGEIGLQLNELGGNLDGLFLFEGTWKNPFGLCPQLTVYTIGLSLSLNLETMLPDSFGMIVSASVGQVNVSGQILVDAATPDVGNAVAMSATNLYLGQIVLAFISDLPSWTYDVLNSISCDAITFSFNPSAAPAQFSGYTAPIAPGLLLNVTNFNYLDLVMVQTAYIQQSGTFLQASLQLAPIKFGNILSVTSATNANQGPSGSFYLSPTTLEINFGGSVSLWGFTLSTIGSFQSDPATGASVANMFLTWDDGYGDLVSIDLLESSGGYATASWSFTITFTLSSTNAGGYFAGVVAAFVAWIQSELASVSSQITTAVNENVQVSINAANAALGAAQAALSSAEQSADAAIQGAENSVNSAQSSVNGLQNSCNKYHSHCKWYEPWNCAAYGGCEAALGIAQGSLWSAQQVLAASESTVNGAIETASASVSAAQTAVDQAIVDGAALIDAVEDAVESAVDAMTSQLSTAVGDFFNLQYLQVSDTFGSSGQSSFAGFATFGCFGSQPQSFAFTLSIASLATTVDNMVGNCMQGLTQWLSAQLVNTAAGPFISEVLSAL